MRFEEWEQFEKILSEVKSFAEVQVLGKSCGKHEELPLIGVSFGSKDPKAPVLGLFAGVHGLERIGSQVVLTLMQSFCETLLWDHTLQETLKTVRILFYPLVNPVGMLEKTRANPHGVDLMRNAPVDADEEPSPLVGGHRLSPFLPWYRGDGRLEVETKAVIEFCEKNFFQSRAVITVDFHSGFGLQDQIWFPYAKTKKPFPHLPETMAFFESFEKTHPHHFYQIEPQALNYTTHGDLWDYIYGEFQKKNQGTYLPLALEMGSWMWIRKNPAQIFSILGPFNPIRPHRQKRVLRRHLSFFEFLVRATASHRHWSNLKAEQKNKYQFQAQERWYLK